MRNIISIDVEDWFHIFELESTPNLKDWELMESRVEKNFFNMLEILEEKNVKATCFFLGWIAEKHPNLVNEAAKRKHEIASHGYAHQLINFQTKSQFYKDVSKTKQILESISGTEVIGYRAPGFSITPETTWAFSQLVKAGYKYDSSLFPAKRGHGYFLNSKLHPFKITDLNIFEFPLTVASVLSKRICFWGGGYLRLFPYCIIKAMTNQIACENRPVIYYVHPREIDIKQPRLEMSFSRKFKSYVNLKTTKTKISKILTSNSFLTFANFLNEHEDYFESNSKKISIASLSN